jgi:hypothetical protein
VKLPEIDEGPVQESSPYIGQVSAATKELTGVVQAGLHAYGQEMVKSQNAKAAADLLSGLENTSLDLRSRKSISTQELRDALGPDFDSLPPEIKAQTVKLQTNPQTGDFEESDRDDIPMFSVAGHIFDAKARKLLKDSTANFSSSGWAAEFQSNAQHEILQQKMRLSQHQMYDAHEFLQAQDTSTAIDLANAGKFDAARQVVSGSRTMDGQHKVQLEDHLTKIEQTRPLYEALRTGDIGTMAKFLPALGDPKQFGKLKDEERLAFTNRFESEIKSFQNGLAQAEEQKLKGAAEAGWNGIFEKERGGQPVSYADIPMPGAVHADQQKAMIDYVDKLNKGEKPETEWGLYAGLLDAARDKKRFANVDLLKFRNRLADSEFKQLLDLQMGMRGGNPEAYDHFVTTDEAINTRLSSAPYKFDVADKSKAPLIGFVKTQVQKALATAQEANGGKPLGLEERDATIDQAIRANVDPRKEHMIFDTAASVPAFEALVPPSIATTFRRAVSSLDHKGMKNDSKKAMEEGYKDYTFYEPMIERAWQVQQGKNVLPDDAVRSWYHLKANWTRLEGVLRATGGWVEDEAIRKERLANLAVSEVLRKLGH